MMIPYGRQSIDSDDIESVIETLKSSFLTQGSKVPAFEKAIATLVDAQFAIATSSATAALHISCLALSLSAGDIGWTVPLTFAASANAIRYCGADIDFVDIELPSGCICITSLSKKLARAKAENKLPKVLIVVHYSGISCDMEAISKLCKPLSIAIIEDASHAIGGFYQGKAIGCCQYSDLTVFSFHPVKIITSGEGGMVTTKNKHLADKLKLYSAHGIKKSSTLVSGEKAEAWQYEQHELGFNYRMSDIHAALGLSQLNKLPYFVEQRNKQALYYAKALNKLPIQMLTVPPDCLSPWHIFVIRINDEAKLSRKQLYYALKKLNIGSQVHYIPVHTLPYYQALGCNWGDFPNAENFYQHCLSIPLFPKLKEQDRVIEKITNLLSAG